MANTKKTQKGTGFGAPVYGNVAPKGSVIKKLPNGRIKIVEPKKRGK